MGRRPYCLSRMEVSYCTFGFGVIIRHDLRTLSLPRYLPRDNICVRDLSPCGKGNSCLTKLFGGLRYEKIRRYNNSAKWQDGSHNRFPLSNFLGPKGCWLHEHDQSICSYLQQFCMPSKKVLTRQQECHFPWSPLSVPKMVPRVVWPFSDPGSLNFCDPPYVTPPPIRIRKSSNRDDGNGPLHVGAPGWSFANSADYLSCLLRDQRHMGPAKLSGYRTSLLLKKAPVCDVCYQSEGQNKWRHPGTFGYYALSYIYALSIIEIKIPLRPKQN